MSAQSWDWKDPNDLGFIDFGDNKLIGYNLLGLGLSLILDKQKLENPSVYFEGDIGLFNRYGKEEDIQLWMLNVRKGKDIRKHLTLGGGIQLYYADSRDDEYTGVGIFPYFTWHIIRKEHFTLSYDNGVGPNFFFESFPSGGTKFNFTTFYGLKLSARINNKWLYLHLGNEWLPEKWCSRKQ